MVLGASGEHLPSSRARCPRPFSATCTCLVQTPQLLRAPSSPAAWLILLLLLAVRMLTTSADTRTDVLKILQQ